MTYDSANDVTTFTLGAGFYSSRTLTAYCITDSDAAGKSYDIPSSAITGTAPNQQLLYPEIGRHLLKLVRLQVL